MKTCITPDVYRVKGEKTALFWGFGSLAFILAFITALSVGILTLIVVATTAIVVWVQQSQLMGSAAKVSHTQFPRIFDIAQEAASRLDMSQPDIFIRQSPLLNAFAIGFLGTKSVVLHSATVEAMDDKEIEFIIGHEFSHIKCGHTNISVLTSSSRGIGVPIISHLLSFVFLFWSRKAEYTCDRGGLLANQDPKAAVTAMCKLAVGPALFCQMDVPAFMNQRSSLDRSDFAQLSEKLATHPYLVKRIHAIQSFFSSSIFSELTGNSLSSPPCSTGESSCQETLQGAKYRYAARAANGDKRTDTIVAKDKAQAIRQIEKLGYFPVSVEQVAEFQVSTSGNQIRPWVRFWARMLDFYLFAFLVNIAIAYTLPILWEVPDALFGLVLIFAYVFVEPAMLAGCGTTPGKALLRIRVRKKDGTRLSYSDGLQRSLAVWFRGQGIGIPIIAFYTLFHAYERLKKEGTTSWDKDGQFMVSHQTIGGLRITASVLIFLGFFVLIAIGLENS